MPSPMKKQKLCSGNIKKKTPYRKMLFQQTTMEKANHYQCKAIPLTLSRSQLGTLSYLQKKFQMGCLFFYQHKTFSSDQYTRRKHIFHRTDTEVPTAPKRFLLFFQHPDPHLTGPIYKCRTCLQLCEYRPRFPPGYSATTWSIKLLVSHYINSLREKLFFSQR